MSELKIRDLTTMDFMGLFSPDGEQVIVSSRDIGKYFDKEHKDIVNMTERRISTIKSMNDSEKEKFLVSFKESEYKSRGKVFKEYLYNKDGFMFIAMGLEGIEAEKLKINYISMFNTMADLILTRGLAKIGYKQMSKEVKSHRERLGKDIKWFHYAREADMLNKIVLGMTAKQFKDANGMEIHEATREMIPEWKLAFIDKLERFNTDLLEMDMSFTEREAFITKRYMKELEKRLVEVE